MVQGYCVKCRAKREIKNAVAVKLKNGKTAMKDKCHACGATTTKSAPIVVKRAHGSIVEDVDGNLLIDFASGISVLNVGHTHPKVVDAISKQASEFTHFAGTDFYYDVQARLAERLGK